MNNLFVLIGPSGSGKSTIANHLQENRGAIIYSWDALRLDWYSLDYAEAFRQSCEDTQFYARAMTVFRELVQEGSDIVVDNVNLTRKSRGRFLKPCREQGYNTIAVTFANDLSTLVERQLTRDDKTVPAKVVEEQYNRLEVPTLDEFDLIINSIKLLDSDYEIN